MRLPVLVLLLGAALLAGAAATRGAEYDEAYSLFLVAGTPRPAWPDRPFRAGTIRQVLAGRASLPEIARELRRTDVHPPLYFWALALWRRLVGGRLFPLRLLSGLSALAALALVGAIAARAALPPAGAMALTLGCYGFAYTGAIARDFALAEALVLAGVWLALDASGRRGRGFAAGLLLGAACFTNYLAAFQAAAVGLWLLHRAWPPLRRQAAAHHLARSAGEAAAPFHLSRSAGEVGARSAPGEGGRHVLIPYLAGLLPWLPAGLWFFLAQRDSRPGQFPPFRLLASLRLLARDGAGAVFGGLPLYLPGAARPALAGALGLLLAALASLVLWRWRAIGRADARPLLGLAAIAPPVGLLLLGLAFDSTPIELRYLAFATPFLGLLLAGALAALPRRARLPIGGCVALVQALALAGLLIRPETMQPARDTATAAARLAGRAGLVLLPRGNDGVGVVGPFLIEAPPWLHVLVVDRSVSPHALRAATAGYHRLVVAEEGVDADSRATLPRLRAALAPPFYVPLAQGWVGRDRSGPRIRVFERAPPPGAGRLVQAAGGPATISSAR